MRAESEMALPFFMSIYCSVCVASEIQDTAIHTRKIRGRNSYDWVFLSLNIRVRGWPLGDIALLSSVGLGLLAVQVIDPTHRFRVTNLSKILLSGCKV